jgi:histone-lysine N-methyltransferase SETMAR
VPEMLTAEINAPAHTSHVAMADINECDFQLLCHPPYSPDLAPSDFNLFILLKDSLRGYVIQSNEVVIQAINEWIEEQEQRFFLEGVKALEHRWEKRVAL